jgi:hypothetical protein
VIRKTTRFWAIATIVALVFVGCGGGDDPEPSAESTDTQTEETDAPTTDTASAEEFVTALCTEMGNWIASLQEGQTTVTESVEPGNIQSGIDALAAFFDSAVTATEDLIAGIEAAGVPDVDGGEEIQQEFIDRFTEAKTALESARDQVDALPADDPQAFQDAAGDLSTTIQAQLSAVGDALSTLSQPELDQEAASNTACTSLQSAGG